MGRVPKTNIAPLDYSPLPQTEEIRTSISQLIVTLWEHHINHSREINLPSIRFDAKFQNRPLAIFLETPHQETPFSSLGLFIFNLDLPLHQSMKTFKVRVVSKPNPLDLPTIGR